MLRVLELGRDVANGEMRYAVTREDGGVFEVRISLTAKAMATPSPERRIIDWYKNNPVPEARTSVAIPDDQFDPHYHRFDP